MSGMTATAVSELGTDGPSLLVCVDQTATFFCADDRHSECDNNAVVIGAVRDDRWSAEVDPVLYLDGGYADATKLQQ